jgi:hypothetical protein
MSHDMILHNPLASMNDGIDDPPTYDEAARLPAYAKSYDAGPSLQKRRDLERFKPNKVHSEAAPSRGQGLPRKEFPFYEIISTLRNCYNLDYVLEKICKTLLDGVINDAESENQGLIMIEFILAEI